MSTAVTLAGSQYNIPAYQDTGYAQGTGNLSSYLIALATASLTVSGGTVTLTADANFGGSFGLVSIYYKSRTANVASAGVLRLANTDLIEWRDNANANNLIVAMNSTQTGGATFTIPDVGASASFVMTAGAQTVAGAKTFSADTTFSADAFTVAYTNYSTTSTIVGWSSFTNKLIYYKKIGKLVFIWWVLSGTSNSTSTSFTVPFTAEASLDKNCIGFASDNGGTAVAGFVSLGASTAIVVLVPTVGGSASSWTNSGTKVSEGQLFYQTT